MATNDDFVRADFDHLAQALLQNEELGERRVTAFVGLCGAFFAAVGFIGEKVQAPVEAAVKAAGEDDKAAPVAAHLGISLHGAAAAASVLLLGIGLLTLARVLRRNAATDGFIKALNAIRKDQLGEDGATYLAHLVKGPRGILSGGQAYVVAIVNVGIAMVLTWALAAGRTSNVMLVAVAVLVTMVQYAILYERTPGEEKPAAPAENPAE